MKRTDLEADVQTSVLLFGELGMSEPLAYAISRSYVYDKWSGKVHLLPNRAN